MSKPRRPGSGKPELDKFATLRKWVAWGLASTDEAVREQAKQTNDLFALVGTLRAQADDCKHPGCCCVCGHRCECPEDGRTAGLSPAITD